MKGERGIGAEQGRQELGDRKKRIRRRGRQLGIRNEEFCVFLCLLWLLILSALICVICGFIFDQDHDHDDFSFLLTSYFLLSNLLTGPGGSG